MRIRQGSGLGPRRESARRAQAVVLLIGVQDGPTSPLESLPLEFIAAQSAVHDVIYSSGGVRRRDGRLPLLRASVSVDLSLGLTLGGSYGVDRFVGPWTYLVGTRSATLIGDAGANEIFGMEGDDHIEGRAGDEAPLSSSSELAVPASPTPGVARLVSGPDASRTAI